MPDTELHEVGIISRYGDEPFDCDLTRCGICLEDFTAGMYYRPAGDYRRFYRDDAEQLIVCEKCLPEYLSEQGATHARKT